MQDRREAEQRAGVAFAECVAANMSPQAMHDLVLYQYRHHGIDFVELQAKMTELSMRPLRDQPRSTEPFERDTTGFGWQNFHAFKEHCHTPDLTQVNAWSFWQTLEAFPPFAAEVERVRARDDAILAKYRAEQAQQKVAERQKQEQYLFKKP